MQIGRKIYFEIETGNILLDTGDRSGEWVETTKEQDFESYAVLNSRVPDSVDYLSLAFGQDADKFEASLPYHIDVTATPTLIWDALPGETLDQVRIRKIGAIIDLYNQKLSEGFTSMATGDPYTFGYGINDQMKFMRLAIGVLSGVQGFPVEIPAKDNTKVPHSQLQYQALMHDIANFDGTQNSVEHNFIDQVNACNSIEEINAIVIDFG